MRKIALIIIPILNTYAFCNSNSKLHFTPKNEWKIEITNNKLSINSINIPINSDINKINSIIGNPSKQKIQLSSDIEKIRLKYGTHPNNIFTWDNYGILVYQNPENGEINSLSIDFIKQDYNFSPSQTFSGILLLDGVRIDQNTTLESLKKIAKLKINESNTNIYRAKYGNFIITIEISETNANKKITSFSINTNSKTEIVNSKGWTDSQIKILKAVTGNLEYIKDFSIKYKFEIQEFVECYADKVTNNYTMKTLENQSPELQTKILEIIEDCIIQTSKN